METVQIKDKCWTCLGMNPKCEICQGTGEVINWITFDELLDRLLELKQEKDDREQDLTNSYIAPDQTDIPIDIDINILPNPNI